MKLHPAVRALLWPASVLYGGIVRLRAWLYLSGVLPRKRLRGVVISVGNLTVGGTGKTPMVMLIAQRLFDERKPVGILSRGYRGRAFTDRGGFEEAAPLVLLSDETRMLGNRLDSKVRIGVGANRFAHGTKLEREGIEWFVLDDGFQHMRLRRDVDIVLVDATDPFGGGRLLPAGRLREPKSALARADMVVITRSQHAPAVETVIGRHTRAPIFYATVELDSVFPAEQTEVRTDPASWLGKKMFVFSGIGNPGAFANDVRRWGMDPVGHMSFPDHHRYTQENAAEIERRAQEVSAYGLVCTEKDTFNFQNVRFRNLPLFVCRATMALNDADQFWKILFSIIKNKRGEAA